jgi:hypothetical protein
MQELKREYYADAVIYPESLLRHVQAAIEAEEPRAHNVCVIEGEEDYEE